MKAKFISVAIILVLFTLIISACGSTKQSDTKVLQFANGAEPETLDPRKAVGLPEAHILRQIYEGLCSQNETGAAVPGVAERWEISNDGLIYTFHLRKDAKWSNGDPVRAQDFEYAWKSVLNPDLGSRYAEQLFCLKNAENYNKAQAGPDEVGVKAVDDSTLLVTLEHPVPYFLSLTTFWTYYPVHKQTVENNKNWSSDPATIIANGPFKVVGWQHNSKLELTKNDYYWSKDSVKLNKIDVTLCDNIKTVMDMYENNQIDVADVTPPLSEIPRLMQEKKVKILPYVGTYQYLFNVTKPPFDNVKVRKAFALAINRSAIVQAVTRGGEKPALAWAPFGFPDALPGSDFRQVGGDYFADNDVATAQKLLAEAGYPGGKGLPPIVVLYNTSEANKAVAEAIQEMWKKNLGVSVELTNQEWKVYLQARSEGDFQVARRSWIADYLDPMTAMETMVGSNPNNCTKWSNPEYDKIVARAKATQDNGIRMKLLHDAERILINEMPFIPIYFSTNKVLERTYVKGVSRDALGSLYLKGAYIEK